MARLVDTQTNPLRNFPSNGKKASVRTLSLKGAKELLRKFARAIVVT